MVHGRRHTAELARRVLRTEGLTHGYAVFGYGAHMAYWYNVKTGTVETEQDRSGSNDLLGPFTTRHDAENALATSEAHGRAAEASDAAWNQDDEDAD